MRRIASVKNHPTVKRVMLYGLEAGYYLFTYDHLTDGSAAADQYFTTLDELYEVCQEDYSISKADWLDIADPGKNFQHDWIAPVRIKGRETGKPEWGKWEKLIDGKWVDVHP